MQQKKLKEVAQYINGRGFKKKEWSKTGKPIIRIQNLTKSREEYNRFDGFVDPKHHIKSGDLLISWSATIDSYLYKGEDAYLNQHIYKVIPNINKKYLFHFIKFTSSELKRKSHGSGMKHITKKNFESIDIPVPKDSGKQIAHKLDSLFSKIDAGEDKLKEVEEQLEVYKQAVLKKAFENKTWEKKKIEDISTSVRYGSSKKTRENIKGIPVLGMGHYDSYGEFNIDKIKYLPTNHDEFPELILQDGDLLFNRTNSAELVGKTAVWHKKLKKASFASYLIRVKFEEKINPDFIAYYINSIYGRIWIKQVVNQLVGQANVNGTKLKNLEVPVPKKIVQDKIVMRIRKAFFKIKEFAMINKTTLSLKETLKQSILKKAFEGELI
ncbi:restriction endonuclease subunit S [Candidatus Dojkabacteria bacterium]|nr:restriction endonuclease subunit S [Candidatus Dojkabacteria bacterium]